MGLDTSHDCWHGSYSWFHFWRTQIARAAGWPTGRDQDYRESAADTYLLDRSKYAGPNYGGQWREDPVDPLEVLLAHSDCDGIIPTRFCLPLAERLAGIIPALIVPPEDEWVLTATTKFIAGLRLAHSLGEDVDFH